MFLKRFTNDALHDDSREESVRGVARAVEAVRGRFGETYPAIIDGKPVATAKTIASLCPSNPEVVIGRISSCSREDVDRAMAAAKAAFASWSRTNPEERAETLLRLAAPMREQRFELLALLAFEIGKDWYEADAEIAEAIDFCEYDARLARTHFQYHPLTRLATEDDCYAYIPLGVGAVVAPGSFPLAILGGMTMAAVVAGDTVVLNPSSDTPILAYRLVEMAHEAGVPAGVINLVPGSGGEIGDDRVTHPEVRFVSFTGSAEVGLHINEIIARPAAGKERMTRYVSEMGGKNAIIVDETADLESAAIGAVRSAFGFQGQKCSACSRLMVDRRVHGKLVEMVLAKATLIPVGDPWEDPCVFTGPVANDTLYGLTGAVDSTSIDRIDRAKREDHAGNLSVNRGCTGALVGVRPFGGFDLSGTDSKTGGPDDLTSFTQGKTTSERITVARLAGIGV